MGKNPVLWAIICLLVGGPLLPGQSTGPSTRPAAGTSELERLRAENVDLRKQIAALQEQITELKAPSAATQPGGSSTKPEPVRPFTTMADILVNTPADIRPQANAQWYKYTEYKFMTWVKPQVVGMTFEASLKYGGGSAQQNLSRNEERIIESAMHLDPLQDSTYGVEGPNESFCVPT